jgi:hypothetical protein
MIGNLGFVLCCMALIGLRSAPTAPLLFAMIVAQGTLGYSLTSVMGAIPAEIFEGPPLRPHLRHRDVGGDPGRGGGAVGRRRPV